MSNFPKIKETLEYIDDHLGESISLERIAGTFHFSPFYFHRMFSLVAGKSLAAYIRERRIMFACMRLHESDTAVVDIALKSGFSSAQSFSWTFKRLLGVPPTEYRRRGIVPTVTTTDELIAKFTNRLKGGLLLNPSIIRRGKLIIAGTSGDGNKTGEVWSAFERLSKETPLMGKLSENGYEIRLYENGRCTVFVGNAVESENVDAPYETFTLPKSHYAAFDVFVANGYGSENGAMEGWLNTNSQGYSERLLRNTHYCVEFYDERFRGNEIGSLVEIWLPIEKLQTADGG